MSRARELGLIGEVTKRIKGVYKYSNDGEAFAHLFVKNYLSIDDDEASNDCQVGVLGKDKGIDAFHVDEDTNTIYIFGITMQRKSFGPSVLTDIERAHKFLSNDLDGKVKDDLLQTWHSYRDWKEKGFAVVYIRGILGKLNDEARNRLKELKTELEKDKWSIAIKEELDTIAICLPMEPGRGPDVELKVVDKQPLLLKDDVKPRAMVFSVSGDALGKIVSDNRSNIFALNLREYLGSNYVNKKIAESLTNAETQKVFWYLNLGIDAVCDSYQPLGKDGFSIKNFRIVNGCQTCIALYQNPAGAKNASVMIRLVETTENELSYNIAVSKNRQTAIKDRDLVSLDETQRRIQGMMRSRSPPFFYQRRDGEWNSTKGTSMARKTFGGRWVDNKICAKAYVATILGEPFEAKHKTKKFFQAREDGGLYEKIFHDDLDAQDFIVAYEIYSTVLEQIRAQKKEYRRLLKASADSRPTPEEAKRLKNLSYLVNADTYLAALVWFLGKRAVGKKNMIANTISLGIPTGAESKKKRIINLYKVAANQVINRLSTEESVRTDEGRNFIIRNYFATPETYGKLKDQTSQVTDEEVSKILTA